MITNLIDGDIVAFRCAASADTEENVSIALMRVEGLMQEIMQGTGATAQKTYLSAKKENNYRYAVDPQYKANRVGVTKPIWLDSCKQFLVTNWGAITCLDMEADDGMGIDQRDSGTVICSIDKDMLQVPGMHYNFVKKKFTEVSRDDGLKTFYKQTLIGDTSDNVIGVHGIGPVKAEKLLGSVHPEEYYGLCRDVYDDIGRYHRNCQLLWILREPKGYWKPPEEIV